MGEYNLSIIAGDINPGIWTNRSKFEKRLIVSIVVLFILSFGLIIGLIVVKHSAKNQSESGLICETEECLIAAAEIQSSLDTTADPCDDFYQYACGGWINNNIIPPDKSKWSQFQTTEKRLMDNIRVILETDVKDNHTITPILKKTIGLYKECTNLTKRESDGIHDLKEFILSIEWPLINEGNLSPNYDWLKVYAELTRDQNDDFIFSNGVMMDEKNTTIYTIYVNHPSFGIGREQLIKQNNDYNKRVVKAYKEYILDTVKLFSENTYPSLEQDIDLMVDFEKNLANITTKPSQLRNRTEVYGNKITLNQFSSKYPGIPLISIEEQLFKDIPDANITKDTLLVVYDRQFFEKLGSVLSKTDNKTIANYLGWRAIKDLGKYTNKAMRNIMFEFNRKASGVKEPTPLWEECIKTVNIELSYAVGRLYVDKHFSEKSKQDINQLIDQLKKAFGQLLDNNDWMERRTKDRAFKKLDKMLKSIGYPDFIKQDDLLEKHYKDLNFDLDSSYFKSILSSNKWSSQRERKKLHNIVTNRTKLEWGTGGAIVDAYFMHEVNRITFPAGILQSPFYKLGLPISLNLGAIGYAIGHEITHSFDDEGSQYDELGNLYNWWDEITREKFKKKVQCFNDQYSNYKDPFANRSINGNLTIGENIADNGGLRQAFKALENYRGIKQLLPASMKSFTNEQLFFLSFANIWCKNSRKEALIRQIETDVHSPAKYRVWGSVSNSESFAKAFNCKIRSKMNPKSKCILW